MRSYVIHRRRSNMGHLIRIILTFSLFFFGATATAQYLISVSPASTHPRVKYFLLTQDQFDEYKNSSHLLADFRIYEMNIFEYILCCERGSTATPNQDSVSRVDSLTTAKWKEQMIGKYNDAFFEFNRSMDRGELKGKSYTFSSRHEGQRVVVSVNRLKDAEFCDCFDSYLQGPVLTFRNLPGAVRLKRAEKKFFRRNIQSLLKQHAE